MKKYLLVFFALLVLASSVSAFTEGQFQVVSVGNGTLFNSSVITVFDSETGEELAREIFISDVMAAKKNFFFTNYSLDDFWQDAVYNATATVETADGWVSLGTGHTSQPTYWGRTNRFFQTLHTAQWLDVAGGANITGTLRVGTPTIYVLGNESRIRGASGLILSGGTGLINSSSMFVLGDLNATGDVCADVDGTSVCLSTAGEGVYTARTNGGLNLDLANSFALKDCLGGSDDYQLVNKTGGWHCERYYGDQTYDDSAVLGNITLLKNNDTAQNTQIVYLYGNATNQFNLLVTKAPYAYVIGNYVNNTQIASYVTFAYLIPNYVNNTEIAKYLTIANANARFNYMINNTQITAYVPYSFLLPNYPNNTYLQSNYYTKTQTNSTIEAYLASLTTTSTSTTTTTLYDHTPIYQNLTALDGNVSTLRDRVNVLNESVENLESTDPLDFDSLSDFVTTAVNAKLCSYSDAGGGSLVCNVDPSVYADQWVINNFTLVYNNLTWVKLNLTDLENRVEALENPVTTTSTTSTSTTSTTTSTTLFVELDPVWGAAKQYYYNMSGTNRSIEDYLAGLTDSDTFVDENCTSGQYVQGIQGDTLVCVTFTTTTAPPTTTTTLYDDAWIDGNFTELRLNDSVTEDRLDALENPVTTTTTLYGDQWIRDNFTWHEENASDQQDKLDLLNKSIEALESITTTTTTTTLYDDQWIQGNLTEAQGNISDLNGKVTLLNESVEALEADPDADTLGGLVCGNNQIPKNVSGNGWACASDSTGVGDIEGVTAGMGLSGGGASGTVTLSILPSVVVNQTYLTSLGYVTATSVNTRLNNYYNTSQLGGDLATTTPVTGAVNDIFLGTGTKATIGITVDKDIVAGMGLSGGSDNVLTGADGDVVVSINPSVVVNQTYLTSLSYVPASSVNSRLNNYYNTTQLNKDLVPSSGLVGGADNILLGADSDVTVKLMSCGNDQILKNVTGTGWACAADNGATYTANQNSGLALVVAQFKINSTIIPNWTAADIRYEEEVTEGSLADSVIVSDDIKVDTIAAVDIAADAVGSSELAENIRITGSIQAGTLNATTAVNTPLITNSGEISLRPNGDVDDYYQFTTIANIPAIKSIGSAVGGFYFTSDLGGSNNAQILVGNGVTQFVTRTIDGQNFALIKYNATDATHPGEGLISNTDTTTGYISIIPGDTTDYIRFERNDGTTPMIKTIGGGTVYWGSNSGTGAIIGIQHTQDVGGFAELQLLPNQVTTQGFRIQASTTNDLDIMNASGSKQFTIAQTTGVVTVPKLSGASGLDYVCTSTTGVLSASNTACATIEVIDQNPIQIGLNDGEFKIMKVQAIYYKENHHLAGEIIEYYYQLQFKHGSKEILVETRVPNTIIEEEAITYFLQDEIDSFLESTPVKADINTELIGKVKTMNMTNSIKHIKDSKIGEAIEKEEEF